MRRWIALLVLFFVLVSAYIMYAGVEKSTLNDVNPCKDGDSCLVNILPLQKLSTGGHKAPD